MSPLIRFAVCTVGIAVALGLSTLTAADPPAEVVKLIAQLKDPDEAVRLKAAKDLGKLKDKAEPAMDLLRKVASADPDEDVRAVAKKSLALIRDSVEGTEKEKDKEIVAPFVKALASKKAAERVDALDKLTKLGERGRSASPAIVQAMLDPVETVREAAAACLEKVDPTIHKHVVSLLYDNSDKSTAVAELGKLGARAKATVPVLKQYYSANTATQRAPDTATLNALVEIVPDDPQIVQEVLLIVSAPDSPYRKTGLKLLEKVEATKKKKAEALIAALSDVSCRVVVIERLAKYGEEAKPALPLLKKFKLDSNAAVRDAATKAIETITAE